MPTLAPPPEPIPFVCQTDGYSLPARWAVRDEGRLLTQMTEQAIGMWPSHSAFLTREPEPVDQLDTPLAYLTFPTEKTVHATFTYAGDLQPMPLPDLDD